MTDGGERGLRTVGPNDHRGPTVVVEGALPTTLDGQLQSTEASFQRTVLAFLAMVRRRWILVAAVWLLFAAPVTFYAVTAVPLYTARGAVQVSDGGSGLGSNPLADLVGASSQAEVQTEVEIIRRREFLAKALMSLGLQLEDPEAPSLVTFNPDISLRGASPTSERLRELRGALQLAEARPGVFEPVPIRIEVTESEQLSILVGVAERRTDFEVGEVAEDETVRIAFNERPLPPGTSLSLLLLPEGELLEKFGANIHVRSLGTVREPTNIVEISAVDPDRETARQLVQALMDAYLEKNLEWQSKSASQAAMFIEEQLEEVRASLLEAEEDLMAYSRKENAVQLDTQAKVAIENAASLEAQRVAIELQERTIQSVLHRLRSDRGVKASVTANFFEDPVLAASVQSLTEAETRYETTRASLTDEHPHVQEAARALQYHKAEVTRLMRSARRNLSHQKKQLESELSSATEAMNEYPEKQLELARLARDMEVSKSLYTLLLEKHEEAEIMKASTTTDKRVVDAASLPHKKTYPRRTIMVGFGAAAGLLLGLAAAVIGHHLQRRLETIEAVREVAAFPTYGTVPLVEGTGDDEHRYGVDEIWQNPHEPAPEAFRALGVSISLLPTHSDLGRLIMVTSSQPKEGKSTVASNLSVALARSGKRVLIVDLDLRKPVQHRIWGLPREPGYSDLLGSGGNADHLSMVGHKLERHGDATVLTAGTRMPDTVAAIMAPTLSRLLEEWRKDYDYIILDSPPAFVAETTALAMHVDLVVLVARPGVVERSNLRHAIEALGRAQSPRALVLNAVGRQHAEYYYGSGYYYYGSKYGEGDAGDSDSHKKSA